MNFEYLVSKNARLRAHISPQSNLRHVKTVLEHFDDRQRTDFRNSCLGFLSEPQQRTYDAFFKNIKLHVFAMLRPTEAELGQPYISILLLFEDHTVPALDDVARDIIPSQLHPKPLASGKMLETRGESGHWFPMEEALRTMMSWATVTTRGPVRRLEVIRVETAMERPRTRGTVRMSTLVHRRLGHIPLPPCTDVLLPFIHPPDLMYDKVKPLERAS
ncbi:Hypothetical predicted protein [Olea europaea subsp. europaea]|uniref:Uncharacterized protein n=1 Tax=Olea europaea subsp. europaea TaxID=158383 RepID=A0A8S0ULX0_OLEEU|nr:Hypothetical predicted protein [Olea europaea subsp. europaea]